MKAPGPFPLPTYSLTAALYDRMVGLYAFDQWKENFERLEKRYHFDLSVCGDVACGTGLFARYLAERGASVMGFDKSPEMLRAAACALPCGKIKLLRQDMRYLQPPSRLSLIVCATDSLNYLLSGIDVTRTLRSFFHALLPGGHAAFDMNTAWQLREGSDAEPWDFEVDGVRMRWLSSWDEAQKMASLRLVFPEACDDRGNPGFELHREKAYPVHWIIERLLQAGFARADALDAAGLGMPGERTRRVQFVALKV
jgi:SAM-dependent methyltransferase